jgi:predicted ArsR family transcriptional regulator
MMHRLDSVGDRELRATLLFARTQPSPVTADEVAGAQGIHRNVARARLERLAEAGLLIRSFERRTGRAGPGAGRPAKTYRVAPELTAIEFPARRYEVLIGLIADALPAGTRRRRLHEVGIGFGRALAADARVRSAKTFETGMRRVCAALGRLGYQAAVTDVTGETAVITTPTCPLRPLVRAQPRLATLDRGMWKALAAAALGRAGVDQITCNTYGCRGDHVDCRVLLSVRGRRDRPLPNAS